MAGKADFYAQMSESVAKTSGALLQAILTVNSFLYTDFSSTTIETVRSRKLEADNALNSLIKYAAASEAIIAAGSPKQAAATALSPEDVLATVASGPSNKQIKTLMNTYGVNAKKAQLILNTAMAGLESAAWNNEADLNNKAANAATLVKETASLTLTVAGTVVTAGGVTGVLTAGQAATAIISGADGVIKVTKSGLELVTGKEVLLPDGSKASMIITTVSAVSDLISLKDLGSLVKEKGLTGIVTDVGSVYTITSKIVDGFIDKTVTLGPVKVDISNGLSVGSSVDTGYINGKLGGAADAPSTMPGTYKINGVKTVVTATPDTMTKAISVLPATDKVDQVKITGPAATSPSTSTASIVGSWNTGVSFNMNQYNFNSDGSGVWIHGGPTASLSLNDHFTYTFTAGVLNLQGLYSYDIGARSPYKVTISGSTMNWESIPNSINGPTVYTYTFSKM
jgi:hypothetical protein